MNLITLIFPERVTFEHKDLDPNQNLSIFDPVYEKIRDGELITGVTLDFRSTKFIYPAYLVFIIAVAVDLRKKGISTTASFTRDSQLHEYIFHSGFDAYFRVAAFTHGKESLNSEVFKVCKYSVGDLFPQRTSQSLVEFIKSKQALSSKVEGHLIDSLHEIIRNIVQHSSFENAYFVGQTFPQVNRIRIVFYDDGQGIKSHLTRMPYSQTHKVFQSEVSQDLYELLLSSRSDLSIITAAKLGVSATNYEDNSGAGLDFIINDICRATSGSVVIISADGYVLWENGIQVLNFPLNYSIQGTLIAVTMGYESDSILTFKGEA